MYKNIVNSLILVFSAISVSEAEIITRLENGETMSLCAIGTSLTAASDRWFDQTIAWLQTEYPGQVTASNRAVAGENSRQGFAQLDKVLAYDNPSAVFIEFAMNDAHTKFNISLEESRSNLQTMVNTIHTWAADNSKTVDIVLLTMNDVSVYDVNRSNLADYYQVVRDVAGANAGDDMLLIDNYPVWNALHHENSTLWKSYLASDMVHPTVEGTTAVTMPNVQNTLLSQTVPEPGTWAMLVAVALVLLACAWHKRKQLIDG